MRIVIALTAALLASGPILASDATDVMGVLRQWITALNKGDSKAALALCDEQAAIIDSVPPYEWHGADACSKWYSTVKAADSADNFGHVKVGIGKARHIELKGDRAYVVVPASLKYKQNGKPGHEAGSVWTLVFQKGNAGWRIAAWTWAEGTELSGP